MDEDLSCRYLFSLVVCEYVFLVGHHQMNSLTSLSSRPSCQGLKLIIATHKLCCNNDIGNIVNICSFHNNKMAVLSVTGFFSAPITKHESDMLIISTYYLNFPCPLAAFPPS